MNKPINIPETTRRIFLKRSIQALGALAVAPVLTSVEALAEEKVTSSHTQGPFSEVELNILSTITDAIIPQNGAFGTGALDVNLAKLINTHLTYADQDMVKGLQGAMLFVEHESPKMIEEKSLKFSQLTITKRTKILELLATLDGVAVQVFAGFKALSLFFFYSTEQSWSEIGHLPPLVQR